MLLPLQGANPNIHSPRALPWAGCLLAFQAVTSQKLYRTPIKNFCCNKRTVFTDRDAPYFSSQIRCLKN